MWMPLMPATASASSSLCAASACHAPAADPKAQAAEERASDQMIYASVKAGLAAQQRLESSRISVEVTQGVVVLSGTVPDEDCKNLAADVAKGVEGVKGLANLLQVP